MLVSMGLLSVCAIGLWADVPTAPLSLAQCINMALTNQADVLVGQQSLLAAKARITQARSNYYPQATFQTLPLQVNGNSGGTRSGSSDTTITVTQNLYDGGVRETSVKQARAGATSSTAALARTRQTVAYNVTTAYYTVLRNRHLALVADAQVAYLDGQLKLIQARVQAGDAAQIDALPIEAQQANARVDQLAAKNAIRTATVQLQNAMGLQPQAAFDIAEVDDATNQPLRPLEAYVTQAQTNRPEVVQTAAEVEAAKAGVHAAQIANQPHLVASGQYAAPVLSSTSATWSISGGLVYNFFNGYQTKAAIAEARTTKVSADTRAAQAMKDISTQVQEAYLNVSNAQDRLTATDISLQAAQKNFEAQDARYKEGLGITLDLLNAQVSVATAQSNAVQARYDYYTALAQLAYALGTQEDSHEK